MTSNPAAFSVVDGWYRSGKPCCFCQAMGLCRHRDVEADTAALAALADRIAKPIGKERHEATGANGSAQTV